MFPEANSVRLGFKIRVFEYGNTHRTVEGLKVLSALVPHVPGYFHSVAYRVETAGRVFFYSGDSGFSRKLIRLARFADLALCEMSVSRKMLKLQGPRPNHLSAFECGLVAARAGVKKLVLAHLYDNDKPKVIKQDVKKIFNGQLVISKDSQVVKF